MKDRLYYIDLYDIYGTLLTEKQQNYFEDYYFSNLSLSEISENMNVTRNAVHKQIKEAEEKLEYYEENLQTYAKEQQLKSVISQMEEEELKRKLLDLL